MFQAELPHLTERKVTKAMIKVEAIVKPQKWEEVQKALQEVGVEGITVTEVRGHGRQKGHTEIYRGVEYRVDLIPKIKIETVIKEDKLEKVLEAITLAAKSGQVGDGKVFVVPVQEVLRIRTGERGESGL